MSGSEQHASASFRLNAPRGTFHSRTTRKDLLSRTDPSVLARAFKDKKPNNPSTKKFLKGKK